MKILIDRVLAVLVIILGILLCIIIWIQIGARSFMSTPPTWTEEISRIIFMWFGTMAAVFAMWKKEHMIVDILYMHSKGRNKMMLDLFTQVCVMIFGFVLFKYGLDLMKIFSVQKTSILRWPMIVFYGNIPVSGFLYLLISIYNTLKLFVEKGPEPAQTSVN